MDNQPQSQNPPVQPLPAQPQLITPPNKTRTMLLLFVALFFLLLTGVAAYLMLWQNPATQPAAKTAVTPPPATSTPDPTANWELYSNANVGFSFSYPKELAYAYDQLGDLVSKKSTQGLLLLQNYDGTKPLPAENVIQFIVDVTRNQTLSLDQYVKNLTASGSATKTTVAGYPALTFITTQKGEQITNTAFKYVDLIYNTSINSIEKEKITLLNNILATFALSASPSAAATITP